MFALCSEADVEASHHAPDVDVDGVESEAEHEDGNAQSHSVCWKDANADDDHQDGQPDDVHHLQHEPRQD